jgi:hypothetical protein
MRSFPGPVRQVTLRIYKAFNILVKNYSAEGFFLLLNYKFD